ncbi:MAG: trypsin-like peptidase domain-containing protein [Deltaproteobacteria bacterium]|nr:trypsin-like peptidase domain-containing protein [Deltaproteobacteria bacterium]
MHHLIGCRNVLFVFFVSVLCIAPLTKAAEPIQVNVDETKSLSLVKLVLAKGTSEGDIIATDGWLSELSQRLKNSGYKVIGAVDDSSVFKKDDKYSADMLLGGTVTDLSCKRNQEWENVWNCGVSIRWELLDVTSEKVVYSVVTRYLREMCMDDGSDEDDGLITGAIDSLLSKPGFVDAMKIREPDQGASDASMASAQPRTFAACPTQSWSLPDDMSQVKDAVATVLAGQNIGAGFYIAPDGIMLTAAHVISDGGSITVKDRFGNQHGATVLRTDDTQDVAVLKVDISQSSCLPLVATAAETGAPVYAIGSPGGEELAFSVSSGIVSALRTWNQTQLIQTDASINAGNSGGPLINDRGEAIGIVHAKIVIPGFEGVGFAVPVSAATQAVSISAGDVTTLNVAEVQEKKPVADAGPTIRDTNDPPISQLQLVPTRDVKVPRIHARDRYLHSFGRWLLLVSGPALFVTGGIMTAVSWKKVSDSKMTLEGSFGVDDEGTSLSKADYDKYTMMNKVGLIMMGVGTAVATVFISTPKRRGTIIKDYRREHAGGLRDASWDRQIRLGFAGNGILLSGEF